MLTGPNRPPPPLSLVCTAALRAPGRYLRNRPVIPRQRCAVSGRPVLLQASRPRCLPGGRTKPCPSRMALPPLPLCPTGDTSLSPCSSVSGCHTSCTSAGDPGHSVLSALIQAHCCLSWRGHQWFGVPVVQGPGALSEGACACGEATAAGRAGLVSFLLDNARMCGIM